jgi:hypothetical protein
LVAKARNSRSSSGRAFDDEVDHADRPAGTAHAQQLIGHCLVIRSEHGAGRGGNDVELAVRKRKRLRVALHPVELDPTGHRGAPPRLEVLRREVERDDVGSCLRRADGHIPRARGDVEQSLPGRNTARFDEHRAELPDELAGEPVVVAERPHGACRRFMRCHVASLSLTAAWSDPG